MATLSARATRWLDELGVTQRRRRLDEAALRRWLAKHEVPAWPALLAVEARYGGLANPSTSRREIGFGVGRWFGRRRMIDGREHRIVAGYSPIAWFMDEAGRVVEIDDLSEQFYESDTIEHRIEQLAVYDRFRKFQELDGLGSWSATAASRAPTVCATSSSGRGSPPTTSGFSRAPPRTPPGALP